ncbi:hypothetical protein Pyrfu_1858 [Pyrolobus fumarii 1A]|uniref:VapB-type antitoxin n=1 Tax=Pyrolobus fumarii (strain DSM 11204 / 1A) TaxID=694429 RepID=G0ECZ1_PYRF1|nr:hypothetical protein [Pyrolobus fumarii]AEM39711.1 hypothetical protein Pyrfu_1858 [Pyrolobus fumarii 1A]
MREYVTVKVSRRTLEQLENLKKVFNARSIDDVIQRLLREYRSRLLESLMGVDAGRVSEFREEDRFDSR